jgi:hypothetical protein
VISDLVVITLYDNGVEIKGHMIPTHCSELSALTWNCSNSMAYWDEKSKGDHTSNTGYSYFAFDIENEKSVFLFEEYKRNLEYWATEMWNPNEYRIEELSDSLNLAELERV